MKEYHKKIEELFRKVFEYKPNFEDLKIQEVGFEYFSGLKGIARAD